VSVRLAAGPLVPVRLRDDSRDSVATEQTPDPGHRISAESVSAIIARDPFLIGRRPLLPAYDPLRIAEQQAPPPPRPVLVLVGVVEGKDPSAVIEGLPGVEGSRVVRVGDAVAGLRVRTIDRARVVIAGMDTTWVLEVKEPWKP